MYYDDETTATNPCTSGTVKNKPYKESIMLSRSWLIRLGARVTRTPRSHIVTKRIICLIKKSCLFEFKNVSSFFFSPDPKLLNTCQWCNTDTLFRREYHFARCCGQFYHWGCRTLYTWGKPAYLLKCRSCGTVNFGEKFMLPLEQYDNLKAKL